MTTILDLWEMLNTIEAGTAPNCTATLRKPDHIGTCECTGGRTTSSPLWT
jgi:hypothetical protein